MDQKHLNEPKTGHCVTKCDHNKDRMLGLFVCFFFVTTMNDNSIKVWETLH